MKTRWFVLTAAMAAIFAVATAQPAPEKEARHFYEIRIDGLNCLFCAYTLEKLSGRIDGVDRDAFDLDLRTGVVTIQSHPESYVSPRLLREAVDNSGFSYRSMKVTLLGHVARAEAGDEFHPLYGREAYGVKEGAALLEDVNPDEVVQVRGSVEVERPPGRRGGTSDRPRRLELAVEGVTSAAPD
jgi:hypothetical protein